MVSSAEQSKRSPRGWWRLASGILLIGGTTLGLAFYWPLRQSQALLTERLSAAEESSLQLSQALESTRATLQRATAERDELQAQKLQMDTQARRFPELAERFVREAEPSINAAFTQGNIHARPLGDGLSLDWTNPALLNRGRSALTRSAQKLLCLSVTEAARAGLSEVTVHTFAAPHAASSGVSDAYTTATTLAISLAEQIVGACSVAPSSVAVASSPIAKDSPLLRFEFRRPDDAARPGL